MSLFDLIFGSSPRYPHVIVYAQTIEKISALSLGREIRVVIDGEKQVLSGQEIKDMLERFVQGGLSLNLLEAKLKAIGLKGDQLEKRKWLMEKVKEAGEQREMDIENKK